ncbi:MAG: alanine--tRNA ligase-related protein [Candidatus Hodarchaeales archaeon]|jgi:misacylated tRNA(Ala) deacylase
MVKELYQDNMSLKEFETEVESVKDGKYVVLNQTAFYPRSGGIDYDEGTLTRLSDGKVFNVIFTGKFGEISHEVDQEGLKAGDKVKGVLNWDRRYKLMRYHTALHVLSGVFYNDLGAKISGNNASVDKGRMDFTLEHFDRVIIEEHVKKANDVIKQDLPVEVYYINRDKLDEDPALTKLVMGLPKGISKVRIVDIKNFDRQPDGGCHVARLSEIGEIITKKLDNRGKNNRRLYFTIP